MTDHLEWPIWKTADPILKEAVLFLDSNEAKNLKVDDAMALFHQSHKVETSLARRKRQQRPRYLRSKRWLGST